MQKKTLEKLERFNVKDLYESGKTIVEISKITSCGQNTISKYLHELKVEIRPASKRESLREVPIIGTKFGQWTVISTETKVGSEVTGNPDYRNIYWKVQCNCGEISWRLPSALKNGTSTACKSCYMKFGDVKSFILSKFNHIVNGLKTRKKVGDLDFNITPEYLQELYDSDHYCKLSGINLEYNPKLKASDNLLSVDRIDSSKGYIKGNVQLVHKDINMMKGTLKQKEFIELCRNVSEHSKCG